MNRVQGKTCIVTGGAVGIGHACVQRLAEEGAAVAIFDRMDGEGQALADAITHDGGNARYWHVDVTREADVARAIDEVADHFGGVDVLVNNAGISGSTKLTHEISEAEWDLVQAVNVKGVLFCCKHAIPHMRRAGGGSIVNLSSIYGLVGAPDVPAYHASKGAVRLMSKTDAMSYAPDRIRVNSVHPGGVATPMILNDFVAARMMESPNPSVLSQALIPDAPIIDPKEVTEAVLWLVGPRSKFVTGVTLPVDAGHVAT